MMFNNPRKDAKTRSRTRTSTPAYTGLPTQSKSKSTPVRSTGTPTRKAPARPGATRVQGTNGPSKGSGLKVQAKAPNSRMTPNKMRRLRRQAQQSRRSGKPRV